MCFTTILFLKIRPLLSPRLFKGLFVGANVIIDCASAALGIVSFLLDDEREKVFPNKI